MSALALQLTTHNGSRYLPYLFASLARQTFHDWECFVLDNGSDPIEAEAIRAAVHSAGFPIRFERVDLTRNFVGGHNGLFRLHDASFVQLLNDDAVLGEMYLEKLVEAFERCPNLGSASGRVFRWDFDRRGASDHGHTRDADSFGLERTRGWRVCDRTQGAVNVGIESVFGVSGCLPMFRRTAVMETSVDSDLFDPAFEAYKEDVELAIRLRRGGWRAAIIPSAVAYHCRTHRRETKRKVPFETQLRAYRNHLWVLAMHVTKSDFRENGFWIVIEEIGKIGYWLFLRPRVLWQAWKETISRRRVLIAKRRAYQHLFESL